MQFTKSRHAPTKCRSFQAGNRHLNLSKIALEKLYHPFPLTPVNPLCKSPLKQPSCPNQHVSLYTICCYFPLLSIRPSVQDKKLKMHFPKRLLWNANGC